MSKKQTKLTSVWVAASNDDCIMLDAAPLPPSSYSPGKKASVSVAKANSVKKASQWVAPSFEGLTDFNDDIPKNKCRLGSQKSTGFAKCRDVATSGKRTFHSMMSQSVPESGSQKVAERRGNRTPETSLWSEKYTPSVQSDLAVHKKKIADVEQWINEHLTSKKRSPILLLTGPAGVGKTATVRVLAKHCELHEWTNPLSSDGYDGTSYDASDWKSRSRVEAGISKSQLSQFQEFLLRANKYNTLDIFGGGVATRRIIMVEDFPNIFYRDATPFHNILRKYIKVGGSPLIFIVSDSTRGDSNERLLFPKDIQAQLGIENISFNPVAMTSLTKILTKIASEESTKGSHKFTVPSKNVIESIAMASSGDIRGALNALQFACLKDTCDLAGVCSASGKPNLTKRKSKKGVEGKKGLSKAGSFQQDDELMCIGGRDTSLFLFRALGKILYCKRDEPTVVSEAVSLPSHLSHHYRDPLQINPEDVIEKSHLSGDFFSAYLHQNYMEFFTEIEDVVCSSEYLSDSDYLTIDWASRSALQHYSSSVAARGIMFSNTQAKHSGWKPLHKPQWYTTSKLARQNCENARYLFRAYHSTPVVLQTEIIPYMSLINTTLHDTGQIALMQDVCRFSNHRRYEKLDEKDMDDVSIDDNDVTHQAANQTQASSKLPLDTDDVIINSQSNVKSSSQDIEEEFVIDDYDY